MTALSGVILSRRHDEVGLLLPKNLTIHLFTTSNLPYATIPEALMNRKQTFSETWADFWTELNLFDLRLVLFDFVSFSLKSHVFGLFFSWNLFVMTGAGSTTVNKLCGARRNRNGRNKHSCRAIKPNEVESVEAELKDVR